MFAQWDDHEVTNDWWPGQAASADGYADTQHPRAGRARRPRLPRIHADARRRWRRPDRIYRKIAYGPLLDVFMLDMRSYRGPNDAHRRCGGPAADLLGPAQIAWLKRELDALDGDLEGDRRRPADRPGQRRCDRARRRAAARPRARDRRPLAFIKHAGIRNTVWLTADMHYTAAHYYDPNRAVFQDFEPFWEFVSGPLHAGTWAPGAARQHVRPARGVPEGLRRRAGREPRALLRPAVLRPRRDRRRDRGDDGHAQGRRGPRLWSTRIEPRMEKWSRGAPPVRS